MVEARKHNKSGAEHLTVAMASQGAVQRWSTTLAAQKLREVLWLCESPCKLIPASDGRLSAKGRKACYAYQLVAREKFGTAVEQIRASKGQDDTVISHLCGTRNCVESKHLVLEPKRTNDERTHCHFVMGNVFRATGRHGVKQLLDLGSCTHLPKCGDEDEVDPSRTTPAKRVCLGM